MRIAVAIPSVGRPNVLEEALRSLRWQTRPPEVIFVGVSSRGDLPVNLQGEHVHVVFSRLGLTSQRNALLEAIDDDIDLVIFLDDDAVLHPDYISQAETLAQDRPDIVLFSGKIVADGARDGEIGRADAVEWLRSVQPSTDLAEHAPAYGCNMVVRAEVARAVKFDEALPLYGWLEDRDFSVRASRLGTVGLYAGCQLVHLGIAGGRQSGVRLGFQQVVHPAYLYKKKVLGIPTASYLLMRPLFANLLMSMSRRQAVDRIGRLRGNMLGLRSLITSGPDPARVAALP